MFQASQLQEVPQVSYLAANVHTECCLVVIGFMTCLFNLSRFASLSLPLALSLRPVNKKSFLQHVEDLCANDNSKFQEEFSVRTIPNCVCDNILYSRRLLLIENIQHNTCC